jgi:hypothetical protein
MIPSMAVNITAQVGPAAIEGIIAGLFTLANTYMIWRLGHRVNDVKQTGDSTNRAVNGTLDGEPSIGENVKAIRETQHGE